MTTNLVVLRNGESVVELGDDELRDTYPVTKSVVSTLAGIALDSGREEELRSLARTAPGSFRYDNGTAHLFACVLWWIGDAHLSAGHLGRLPWVCGDAVVGSNAGEAFVP